MDNLSEFLARHKNLTSLSLNLRGNAITDGGIKKLSEGLGKLSNLKYVSLLLDYNYRLTDLAVQYIGKAMVGVKGM